MDILEVGETYEGKRLDVFVSDQLVDVSRATIQKLIKGGEILVDNSPQKSSHKLEYGQKVSINYSNKTELPDIDLPILYEDDDCVVIDKPVGVLTHSKGAFNPEATVATFVLKHSDKVDGDRSGIVHRLDRATSGVMICAKTPEALSWLQKQFSKRNVKKTYIAVVSKAPNPEHAIIDMPIERNPKKPQTFRVGHQGKTSTTEYEVIKNQGGAVLVELRPVTGRTHQLRVHLEQIGCPIIGDVLYGGAPAERMFLHAHKLEITLPNRERRVFVSEIPQAFAEKISE